MKEYIQTSDPDVLIEREDREVLISDLVAEYVSIRDSVVALDMNQKATPDQETLDFWNEQKAAEDYGNSATLRARAGALFLRVKAVRDAGLLPAQYEDEYQIMVNFLNP